MTPKEYAKQVIAEHPHLVQPEETLFQLAKAFNALEAECSAARAVVEAARLWVFPYAEFIEKLAAFDAAVKEKG